MEHETEAVIISGFSRLSSYELYNHFRAVSLSRDYRFLYAIINDPQSAAGYFRQLPSVNDNIVLNIDIGTRDEHCKFLLKFGSMNGCVGNMTLHREMQRFLNAISMHKGIHTHDDPEYLTQSKSRPASKPFFS